MIPIATGPGVPASFFKFTDNFDDEIGALKPPWDAYIGAGFAVTTKGTATATRTPGGSDQGNYLLNATRKRIAVSNLWIQATISKSASANRQALVNIGLNSSGTSFRVFATMGPNELYEAFVVSDPSETVMFSIGLNPAKLPARLGIGWDGNPNAIYVLTPSSSGYLALNGIAPPSGRACPLIALVDPTNSDTASVSLSHIHAHAWSGADDAPYLG